MNQSISHEAVYRTAPATPGLLKKLYYGFLYVFVNYYICATFQGTSHYKNIFRPTQNILKLYLKYSVQKFCLIAYYILPKGTIII